MAMTLLELPPELVEAVVATLAPRDVVRLSATCQRMHELLPGCLSPNHFLRAVPCAWGCNKELPRVHLASMAAQGVLDPEATGAAGRLRRWCELGAVMAVAVEEDEVVRAAPEVRLSATALDCVRRLEVCTAAAAATVAPQLQQASALVYLSLALTDMGDASMQVVAQALVANPACPLTHLDVSNCDLGADGAAAVGRILASKRSITELRVDWNQLGDAGAEALATAVLAAMPDLQLTMLSMTYNMIGSRGAAALVPLLERSRSLRRLSLTTNPMDDNDCAALAAALERNPGLEEIELGDTGASNATAAALARAVAAPGSRLAHVGMFNCRVSEAGGEAFGKVLAQPNCPLVDLFLGWCNVKDAGAHAIGQALASNTSLTALSLYGNGIKLQGVHGVMAGLAKNTTLATLDLGGNYFGDEGAALLAVALLTCRLRKLIVSVSEIGDDGLAVLASVLHTNTCLTELDVAGCRISDRSVELLAEVLEANPASGLLRLNISSNPGIKGELPPVLAALCPPV